MEHRPNIAPYDEIIVGNQRCIVAVVREPGHSSGDCEVVFNARKPTNRDARWTDGQWAFVESGDYGGYADKYDRLSGFVAKLRGGV